MEGAPKISWESIPNAVDHTPWHKNYGIMKLYFLITILYAGNLLNGYDGTIVSGLQALPSWHEDLGYPSSSRIGLLNAVTFITGICMGPINSYIADKWGRKWPLRLYGWTMVLGTVLGCVAGVKRGNTGYALFVVSRAVTGIGIPPFLMTCQILGQELAHPRSRTLMNGILQANWPLGSTVASFVVFGTSYIPNSWSWRIPYLIQLVPAFYMLIAVQFMPESPRYLQANGREEEARAFLVKYHGNGDEDDELVRFEIEEMKATLEEEIEMKRGEVSWAKIWKGRGNKHRLGLAALMTFMPQMNGSGLLYYYTVILAQVGITATSKVTGIGAGLTMFGFIFQMLGAIFQDRHRRRRMLLVTWPMLIVCMAVMAATNAVYQNSNSTNTAAGIATVVFVWLMNAPSSFVTPLFFTYPAEVLNYSIRGKGMAVWNTVNQAWGAYGAYVNSIALSAIGWKYYCVYLPILAIQWLLVYFFMVETKGYTLEEIAMAFEGNNAAVAQVDARLQHDLESGGGGVGVVDEDVKGTLPEQKIDEVATLVRAVDEKM
ncbi:hypothetical protein IAT38_001826 [Cryptococcus sp. DSM 104549]